MGTKGSKMAEESIIMAKLFGEKLLAIEGITIKKMFGGHGVFHDGRMFGIIDSKGQCFLKVNESNREDFQQKNAKKHGKMPYYAIPEGVFSDQDKLVLWAKKAIAITT